MVRALPVFDGRSFDSDGEACMKRPSLTGHGARQSMPAMWRKRPSLLAFAVLAAALQPALGRAQPASPPMRVTAVSERDGLTLYAKRGTASAPSGARIVVAAIALDPAATEVSTEDLRILLNGKAFKCEALGSEKDGYCPGPVKLTRKAAKLDGYCFTGNIGGMQVDASELSAAFMMPTGLDLGSAQLLARSLGGTLDLESREPVQWPFGLTARIVEVTKHDVGWLIDLEVGNGSKQALPVNPDDLRLGRTVSGATDWRVGQNFFHDRTTPPTDGGNGERVNSLALAPGAKRIVRMTFINVFVQGGEKWMLGYFNTAAVPLKP